MPPSFGRLEPSVKMCSHSGVGYLKFIISSDICFKKVGKFQISWCLLLNEDYIQFSKILKGCFLSVDFLTIDIFPYFLTKSHLNHYMWHLSVKCWELHVHRPRYGVLTLYMIKRFLYIYSVFQKYNCTVSCIVWYIYCILI